MKNNENDKSKRGRRFSKKRGGRILHILGSLNAL
jgi:hypothetical protein